MLPPRFLFALKYALLCALAIFLLSVLIPKHYQLDAQLIIPVSATLPMAFAAAYSGLTSQKKYWHSRIGLKALTGTLALSYVLFLLIEFISGSGFTVAAYARALLNLSESFVASFFFMVPGFILLVYLCKAKPEEEEEEENLNFLQEEFPDLKIQDPKEPPPTEPDDE